MTIKVKDRNMKEPKKQGLFQKNYFYFDITKGPSLL